MKWTLNVKGRPLDAERIIKANMRRYGLRGDEVALVAHASVAGGAEVEVDEVPGWENGRARKNGGALPGGAGVAKPNSSVADRAGCGGPHKATCNCKRCRDQRRSRGGQAMAPREIICLHPGWQVLDRRDEEGEFLYRWCDACGAVLKPDGEGIEGRENLSDLAMGCAS